MWGVWGGREEYVHTFPHSIDLHDVVDSFPSRKALKSDNVKGNIENRRKLPSHPPPSPSRDI